MNGQNGEHILSIQIYPASHHLVPRVGTYFPLYELTAMKIDEIKMDDKIK